MFSILAKSQIFPEEANYEQFSALPQIVHLITIQEQPKVQLICPRVIRHSNFTKIAIFDTTDGPYVIQTAVARPILTPQ